MRVLWLVRRTLHSEPGGDTTQILRTADAIRARGVTVDISDDARPDLRGYDLAHLFHLDRLWENTPHVERLSAAGCPFVLSPIWWPSSEFDRAARAGVQGWLARTVGSRLYASLRLVQRTAAHVVATRSLAAASTRMLNFWSAARALLQAASVILPNSDAERAQIESHFGVKRPCTVVPNAADATLFRLPDEPSTRVGVLSVGRIEPRKNQLALIVALRDSDIPLTLVGAAGRYSTPYAEKCRAIAGPNTRFLPARPPEELAPLYHRALIHACTSWYETPGLVNLEAALCGCAIVATPGGCTREYLGSDAEYADPAEPGSIRVAIQAAMRRGPAPGLAARIRHEFSWENAAKRTLGAYSAALAHGPAETSLAAPVAPSLQSSP